MNLDMTLREFFELSARVGDAARVIREAQAMMGGVPVDPTDHRAHPDFKAGHPHSATATAAVEFERAYPANVLMTNKGPVTLTPEEQAQKDRLRMEREARELEVMPDNIKALMVAKS